MRNSVFRLVAIAFVVALSVMATRIAAQGNRALPNEDVLPALLAEVRGLRAAMEQMASAGPGIQLALGRLQLQEQRINTMIRRLETIRDSLAAARQQLLQHQGEVTRLEAALKTGSMPANEREATENHLEVFKHSLGGRSAEVQRLAAEESSLASDISAEQARWSGFNQRLDELERALTRR